MSTARAGAAIAGPALTMAATSAAAMLELQRNPGSDIRAAGRRVATATNSPTRDTASISHATAPTATRNAVSRVPSSGRSSTSSGDPANPRTRRPWSS